MDANQEPSGRGGRGFRGPGAWLLAAAVVAVAWLGGQWALPGLTELTPDGLTSPELELFEPSITDHLIIVSVDGLRPDAIDGAHAPHIQELRDEGRAADVALTVLPSLTLPSHASMLTGLLPERHGIVWNGLRDGEPVEPASPTVLEIGRRHGLKTAAFLSKSKLTQLTEGGVDRLYRPVGGITGVWAAQLEEPIERFATREKPDLLFVHIGDPDYVGHAFGWMSPAYLRAVRSADDTVEEVVEGADAAFGRGNYTLILTADHGGSGRDHGSGSDADRRIPWIVWGRGVRGSGAIPDTVRTTDTAATALWLLGLPVDTRLDGEPVTGAFSTIALPGSS